MKPLSAIQTGYLNRQLGEVLDFVSKPAARGGPDEIRQWCHDLCAVETLREVAELWAKRVTDLGGCLSTVGLAETLRKRWPATPRGLLVLELKTCEELAGAILCLAVDKAEAEEIFRRVRVAVQLGEEFPYLERERAARQVADYWQIVEVLGNMLLVDEDTLRRFTRALRYVVGSLLPGTSVDPLPEIPNMPPTALSSVDRQRATESEMIPDSPLVGPFPAPVDILESLLDSAKAKQEQEDEARRIAEEREQRLRDHAARRERLAKAFDHAYRFTNEEKRQERSPSPDGFHSWAERFVDLGKVLRECDETIEGLRLHERLQAVAGKTAPAAMKYAVVLLLAASEGNTEAVASALARANGDRELRRLVLWLPFILDNLWCPFPREDGLIPVALSPDGTTLEENQQAEQAFVWSQLGLLSDPAPPARVDQLLDEAARRQQLLARLKLIGQRLETKRSRLVEALNQLTSAIPNAEPYSQDQVMPPDWREVLADALLQVRQAVRDGEFCRGIDLILSQDQTDVGGNDCLAIDLYRRAWSGDRQAILELLKRLDELPKDGDNFNRAAPSQHGVWDAVRARFNVILPWPPQLKVVHPWHSDAVEGRLLQAELWPQPEPVSAPESMPNQSWPLVGERTGRRTPLPELARDENRERQSRYCQGFDPDGWLPALLAGKWRSFLYPREATRESVKQWLEMIDRLRIENLGPFGMPDRADELEADRDNDLKLIRDFAPQLYDAVVVGSTRTPSNSLHTRAAEAQMPASSAEPTATPPVAPSGAATESKTRVQSSMSWPEAAERMKRLRAQGQPWTSYAKLAEQFGCSSGTIHKAIQKTPELQSWAKRQAATPRAQSLNDVVTDRTAQSAELNPEDDAAIREFIEGADLETKAWFLALPCEDQLEVVNDPDKYQRVLGRKP